MPDEPGDCPLVSADELEKLADIFDRYFYADDPESEDCKLAHIEYDNRVEELHAAALALSPVDEILKKEIARITLKDFRSHVSCRCRQVIKRRNKTPKGI